MERSTPIGEGARRAARCRPDARQPAPCACAGRSTKDRCVSRSSGLMLITRCAPTNLR
jgi:hypothetical protein